MPQQAIRSPVRDATRVAMPVEDGCLRSRAMASRDAARFFDTVGRILAALDASDGAAEPAAIGSTADVLAEVVATDLRELDDGYVLTAELPGLSADDVELTASVGMLRLAGEKRIDANRAAGELRVSERRYGRFERGFAIPRDVDAERISADMDAGVLTVRLPKAKRSETLGVRARPA